MAIDGRIPRPDLFMFADTGDEPAKVYEHVEKWKGILESEGFEFMSVTHPEAPLSQHVLNRIRQGLGGVSYPPLYVDRQKTPGRMPIWRGCTRDFKSRLLDKHAKKWAEVPWGYKGEPMVTKILGISHDESSRMKTSDKRWYKFQYPLVEMKITRADCLAIIASAGEAAPRSACVFCPFHSNEEWRKVRSNPEDWQRAVQFERDFHKVWEDNGGFGGLKSKPTLHKSGLPLDEAPIDDDQQTMFSNWENECAGICGV
jgi:hypothetical protein